ncbi:phage/plasmid primase, P4 family [Symbiobacterium thermophilum]|nr:phage/plasmid primase, P4 family [Symbiobacterium thermophilum]
MDLLSRLEGVQGNGQRFKAKCPAHQDDKPSLSITTRDDGKILMHCHAGCEITDIVRALGIKLSDLMPPRAEDEHKGRFRERILKTYDYRDENGKLLYQAVRYVPKAFRQRRPDGRGGWIWNVEGVRRVAYRLPDVIKAVNEGAQALFIVEGEKDADRLWSLGVPATCNAAGAGKWGDGETSSLAFLPESIEVVILPDNDLAGAKHAAEVAYQLRRAGKSVRVVDLPGLPDKGDVSDWLDAGHTVEDLWRVCGLDKPEKAPEVTVVHEPKPAPDFHLTDLGNAQRLIFRHGQDLRYVPAWGKWMVWTGKRWEVDESGEVQRRAKETVRSIYEEAAREVDDQRRKALSDHARRSESEARIRAMVTLACSESGVAVTPDDLDADPMLLNVANGTLDLRTGELRPHNRNDLITKIIPTAYKPDSECPTWLKFLHRVMNGDEDLVCFLAQAVGYSLTGSTREQCMFFLYGTGANGKSTFLETLRWLFGGYAAQAESETFLVRRSDQVRSDIARLVGTRFVAANEVEDGRRLSEVLVKQLTGSDRITARFLYRDFFEFTPTFKIWMAGNHKPIIRGTDEGIWRRLRLIPFEVTIPPEERDLSLMDKLKAEAEGILAWAVDGCLTWQTFGLTVPDAVRDATASYRDEMDVLGEFIAEECRVSQSVQVLAKDLYEAWKRWCEDNGEFAGTAKRFGMKLRERGFVAEKRNGKTYYVGLTLNLT